MKTKFFILLSGIFLSTAAVNAQEVDCNTQLALFTQSAKIKDYDAAKPYYEKLIKNCEASNLAIYQYGERMFKHYAKNAPEAKKKASAEALIENYKLRLKSFPDKTEVGETYAKIGEAMYDNNIGTKEEQLAMFDKAWNEDKESFDAPRSLYVYFNIMVELQDEGKKELQDVFNLYDNLIKQVEEQEVYRASQAEPLLKKQEDGEKLNSSDARTLKNSEIYLSNFSKIKAGINGLLGERADCENLIPLYNKDFEAEKTNVEWLKRAAKRLSAKDCTDDPIFFKLVEALHTSDPSAKSALYLGQLADKDGKSAKALEYYNQSADLEDNNLDKARVYMKIAGNYKSKGSLSTARNYYKKALKAQPSLGVAYLQIASMYASSVNSCGDSAFNKRAVYWLAADYADRAGRVDPSMKSTASKSASSYRGLAPQKSDIFQEGVKEGSTIKIGCWIGESVRVPAI